MDLADLVNLAERRPTTERPRPLKVQKWDYEPWGKAGQACTQRHFHRAAARLTPAWLTFLILVAGRQSGKTESAAAELVQTMLYRPGTHSILLAPTYKIAQAAIRKVLRLTEALSGWRWNSTSKELTAPNGSIWTVFSADNKESVRGPSVSGVFWLDEAAFLPEQAWTTALAALSAAPKDVLVIATTTPAGKNWVHEEFTSESEANESFRFRTKDSPFANTALVEKMRSKMTAEKAAQEFDAHFVDNLLLAFPDRSRLWVSSFPGHKERPRNALGVDLGKEQDWVVLTACNQWGEATPLGRWQHVEWPETQRRVAAEARRLSAVVVLDTGGPAGGPGGVLADYLESDGVEVVRVNTASRGTKAKVVEQARADVQWGRLSILANDLYEQFEHELARFQGLKRVLQGQEVMVYEGPQVLGEHDDCVISLCLANWGRHHAWEMRERVFSVPEIKPADVEAHAKWPCYFSAVGGGDPSFVVAAHDGHRGILVIQAAESCPHDRERWLQAVKRAKTPVFHQREDDATHAELARAGVARQPVLYNEASAIELVNKLLELGKIKVAVGAEDLIRRLSQNYYLEKGKPAQDPLVSCLLTLCIGVSRIAQGQVSGIQIGGRISL